MITKKIEEALNGQFNAEYYSSYLYLSMSSCFDSLDLPGFANWMRVQVQEEMFHAMKMYDYVLERDGRAILKQIEAPPSEWDSPLAVFEATLKHEQKVTSMINELIYLARQEKDNASEIFLQWFVNEQVEEEKNARDMIGKLKLIEGSPQALYMIDQELAQRVYTPPAANA